MAKEILVFGSNEAGIHGAGAARYAYQKEGARYGKGYGHHGNSWAIPTKDIDIGPMPLSRVNDYVRGFIAYAQGHRKLNFKVTCIGCGLAGFTHAEIAPLFKDAPKNCSFDELWKPYLGDAVTYWGSF